MRPAGCRRRRSARAPRVETAPPSTRERPSRTTCGQLVGTSLLCFVVTCLAVAAGIGGGGLLVPLYAFVLGLGPKNAVPVSKATIFGVAIGNVFFTGRVRGTRRRTAR